MPKSSNHLALARQWEMLKLLPARAPGVTARELTVQLLDAGFAVTKRTVERDLNDLSLQFGIVCNDAAMPYGWYWLPGQQQSFGSVDLVDALSLSLAEDVLRQMLPPAMLVALAPKFEQARCKLLALAENPMARLGQKVRYVPASFAYQAPKIHSKILETLQRALVEELQIEVRYAGFRKEGKDLRLHPLSLVQRGNVPYLVATSFDYTDIRLYPVHRFEKVALTEQKITMPEGFSVDDYLGSGALDFGGGESIQFKAKVGESLANYLAETSIAEDQKLSFHNGTWQILATVTDSWQFHFWILSQGGEIEVLEPKSLRDFISSQLTSALAKYT
ncbi:helix-turn-helix transcriptional regulator [Coraliomargarita sp. W4R53]